MPQRRDTRRSQCLRHDRVPQQRRQLATGETLMFYSDAHKAYAAAANLPGPSTHFLMSQHHRSLAYPICHVDPRASAMILLESPVPEADAPGRGSYG